MRKPVYIILWALFGLSFLSELRTPIVILLSILMLYRLLYKFGNGFVLREVIANYTCVIYLLMPLLGYSIYTKESRIARIWVKYMPIPPEQYFSFVLPAVLAFLLGMFFIGGKKPPVDEDKQIMDLLGRIREVLRGNASIGFLLIGIGVFFYFLKPVLPGPLEFIGNLTHLFIFPGLLYIHFQPALKGKVFVYLFVALFFLADAARTGMFTVVFYMGITVGSMLFLGSRISFKFKLMGFVLAISCTFILQLAKLAYRTNALASNKSEVGINSLQNIFAEKASGFNTIFSQNAFFPIYARMNQGYNVSLVMRRIPYKQPFDNGTSIYKSLAASVVPRLLWPDKPQAGGAYNMEHFAGFKIKGWSTNIGPIGEAYGNFGSTGGIIYMFFFGLFIRWAYLLVFKFARINPVLFLWFPVLFFEITYSMENDSLQALNSFLKAGFFIWLLYKLFPRLFLKQK